MRELVYLSKRKLEQFDLGRRHRIQSPLKITIKPPFLELVTRTARPQKDMRELDAVIDALERSDRAPVWFTESVQPGQWVHFEAQMSYTTVGNVVVFLQIDGDHDVRLMLHGSSQHLIGRDPPLQTSVEELSEQASTRSTIDAEAFASVFNHFFDLIEYASRQEINALEVDHVMSFNRRVRAAGLDHVLPTLNDHFRLPYTAAWMAGRARITAVAPRTVAHCSTLFATPLYVEYVSPPSSDRWDATA